MDEQKYNLEESLAELDKLADLSTKETDKTAYEALAEKARIIYEQFPKSEELALLYAMTLFNLSIEQTDLKELETSAKKLQVLQQQFHDSHNIALQYAKILVNLSIEQTDLKELETSTKKLQVLQQQFQDSHDIAEALAMILFNLSIKQTDLKELETTAEKLQVLQQQFQDSYDIAEALAMILFNLSIEHTELKELETTAEKLQVLQQQFQDSHDIAKALAMILFNLSIEQTELKELETTAEKLQVLQQQFQDSHDIAEALAKILFNLSIEQTELKELETSAEKLQVLQQQFPDSPGIALEYAKILVNLSVKQTELKELEASVSKLQSLQERFPDSCDIAEAFAKILFNLSFEQTEMQERKASVSKLQSLQERFDKSEVIAFIYGVFLANLFDPQTKVDEYVEETEKIKKLYKQFSKFMLQIFDDLFFRDDNVCDRKEYKLFNFILKKDLLKNTKYAILQTWVKRYKEDSSELRNLLSIYQLVQKIKYQLGLKDEDKNQVLKFGHYTKGSTLQIMLDQEENEKKKSTFSVSGKTRLYNANYMNDPEEGIVIEQILGLDRRDVLEPSSWFLMSFTNKTDDLAMWSQYGDDAKGVCLVLREDDFSRFTSFNDVSWRQEKNFLEFSDKMYLLKSELNSGFEKSIFRSESENSVDTVNDEGTEPNSVEKDSDSKGNSDYLYRIAYVKNIGEDIELEQTELFSKSEIEDLAKMLISLKEKIDSGSKVTEENYQNAIAECIEEIRYLFKSVDYKYENELRILRYANLDPSNKEIKIDKTSGVGKLYVERKNSIQIGEVIFGPKFPNPEYVTPLLKLLDKKINYKKSTIKFR